MKERFSEKQLRQARSKYTTIEGKSRKTSKNPKFIVQGAAGSRNEAELHGITALAHQAYVGRLWEQKSDPRDEGNLGIPFPFPR